MGRPYYEIQKRTRTTAVIRVGIKGGRSVVSVYLSEEAAQAVCDVLSSHTYAEA
jgi:hypothetical protein